MRAQHNTTQQNRTEDTLWLPPPLPLYAPPNLSPNLGLCPASDRRRGDGASADGVKGVSSRLDHWPASFLPTMSTQAKVKKDKEIIAEYESQVKGRYCRGSSGIIVQLYNKLNDRLRACVCACNIEGWVWLHLLLNASHWKCPISPHPCL